MLSHHPQVAWCYEFEYAVDAIDDRGNWPGLDSYYEWLETHRIFQLTGFTIDRSLNYPQLVDSFLQQHRQREGKPIIGATVHRHFDRLLKIWPEARFIHIIRDPRDVARSCIGMGWAGNVWTGVERWLEAEQLWAQIKDSIPQERQFEVTYEHLIAEPTASLSRLCDFLGIPDDRAMLDYHRTSTYGLPDRKLIGQWRQKLSDEEIQLVEAKTSPMLVERGYELSGLPPLKVTAARAQRLQWQDWWARVRFRAKRNGINLLLADYLSRHLGIKEWQKQVRLQLNTIENSLIE
jgi:hypothetical protein